MGYVPLWADSVQENSVVIYWHSKDLHLTLFHSNGLHLYVRLLTTKQTIGQQRYFPYNSSTQYQILLESSLAAPARTKIQQWLPMTRGMYQSWLFSELKEMYPSWPISGHVRWAMYCCWSTILKRKISSIRYPCWPILPEMVIFGTVIHRNKTPLLAPE